MEGINLVSLNPIFLEYNYKRNLVLAKFSLLIIGNEVIVMGILAVLFVVVLGAVSWIITLVLQNKYFETNEKEKSVLNNFIVRLDIKGYNSVNFMEKLKQELITRNCQVIPHGSESFLGDILLSGSIAKSQAVDNLYKIIIDCSYYESKKPIILSFKTTDSLERSAKQCVQSLEKKMIKLRKKSSGK